MRYAVDIGGDVLVWNDGEFSSENKDLLALVADVFEQADGAPFITIQLDGSTIYSGEGINPKNSWAVSYGLLQDATGGRMKFVAGDRPSWKALGRELEDGAVP